MGIRNWLTTPHGQRSIVAALMLNRVFDEGNGTVVTQEFDYGKKPCLTSLRLLLFAFMKKVIPPGCFRPPV
jgi:hypothetical protein